jgi:hypothetical protein
VSNDYSLAATGIGLIPGASVALTAPGTCSHSVAKNVADLLCKTPSCPQLVTAPLQFLPIRGSAPFR